MNNKNHPQPARSKEETVISDRLLQYHPEIVAKKINCQFIRDCLYADEPGLALQVCNAYIPGVIFDEGREGDHFVFKASFNYFDERYEFSGRSKQKKLAKNDAAIYVVAWFFPYFLDESFEDYCIRKAHSSENFVPPLCTGSKVLTAPVKENVAPNCSSVKDNNMSTTMRVKGNASTPDVFYKRNIKEITENVPYDEISALTSKARQEFPKNETRKNICSAAKNYPTVAYSPDNILYYENYGKPTTANNHSTIEYSPDPNTYDKIATVNNFSTVEHSPSNNYSTNNETPNTINKYSPRCAPTSTHEEISTINYLSNVECLTSNYSTICGKHASVNKYSTVEYWPSNISRTPKITSSVNTVYIATTENSNSNMSTNDIAKQTNDSNTGDVIYSLVHLKFEQLKRLKEYCDYHYDFDMLAGVVLVRANDYKKGEVVAIGTGNRTISTQLVSNCGDVVHDSHAEIICLRALRKYFYAQLDLLTSQPEKSIFTRSENTNIKYALRSDVAFHLYINSTPCGDARVYCEQTQKKAIKKSRGLLRIKSFATNAGTLNTSLQDRMLTLRAVREGIENFTTATCSDKLARANVLGVQGAILCHVIEPIYLSSLTIGRLYDYEHLSRAINDRTQLTQDEKFTLPNEFQNNVISLYKASKEKPAYYSTSTSKYSLNWSAGESGVEVVVSAKGKTLAGEPSRLCKLELFKLFVSYCRRRSKSEVKNTPLTYAECKKFCENYQLAKNMLYEHFRSTGKGWWIVKHPEWDNFCCDILTT